MNTKERYLKSFICSQMSHYKKDFLQIILL